MRNFLAMAPLWSLCVVVEEVEQGLGLGEEGPSVGCGGQGRGPLDDGESCDLFDACELVVEGAPGGAECVGGLRCPGSWVSWPSRWMLFLVRLTACMAGDNSLLSDAKGLVARPLGCRGMPHLFTSRMMSFLWTPSSRAMSGEARPLWWYSFSSQAREMERPSWPGWRRWRIGIPASLSASLTVLILQPASSAISCCRSCCSW
jgi:hypothetical protein